MRRKGRRVYCKKGKEVKMIPYGDSERNANFETEKADRESEECCKEEGSQGTVTEKDFRDEMGGASTGTDFCDFGNLLGRETS